MKEVQRNILAAAIIPFVCAGVILTGCAGPSTHVLPREVKESQSHEVPEENQVLEEGNPFYLQEALNYVSGVNKWDRLTLETEVVSYISQMLRDYGYETSRQSFDGGINVIGIGKTHAPDADILIIGANHNTAPESPGANQSVAGVVTMLECARLVSKLSTDTELRFVSFGGNTPNEEGSHVYIESLGIQERQRVIGVIQLGALGYVLDYDTVIGTVDGKSSLLGDLLREKAAEIPGDAWEYERRSSGYHNAFVLGQIPAVLVSQKWEAYESLTPYDIPQIVNTEQLLSVVDILSRTVADIMDEDTPSLLAKSRFVSPLQEQICERKKEEPLLFGEDYRFVTAALGAEGSLLSTNVDGGGKTIDNYRYRMTWFDVNQIIYTDYHYSDGLLETISLDADGAGITFDEMKVRIGSWYGEPVGANTGPAGTEYNWTDTRYGSFFALIPRNDGYELEIRRFEPPRQDIVTYGMDGTIVEESVSDPRSASLMDMVRRIIMPEDYRSIASVGIYTDGIGRLNGYADSPVTDADGERILPIKLYLDLEDALDEEGEFRNYKMTVEQLLFLYIQLLTGQGAEYEQDFNQRFQPSAAEAETPETVGPPIWEPGFYESFALFVLCRKPEQNVVSMDQRILFFYDYEPLLQRRTWIRNQLQLERMTAIEGKAPAQAEAEPE